MGKVWWHRPLALVGFVGGICCGLVPGYFAWRSYADWRDGYKPRPMFAWIVGGILIALMAASPVVVAVTSPSS